MMTDSHRRPSDDKMLSPALTAVAESREGSPVAIGAAQLGRHTTPCRQPARRGWRWLGLRMLSMLVVLVGLVPGARAQCTNLTVTLSPAVTSVSFSSATTGTVWTGTITVVGTNCTTAAFGGGHWLTVPIGTTAQATTVSGISVIRTGAPTHAVLSGNCAVQYVNSQWTGADATSIGFAGVSGFCSTTMTVPFSFVKSAGTVSGTLSPGQLLATANSVFGLGMTAWAGSIDYGGTNGPMRLGSPPSAVTFTSTGTCTVSAAVTTVLLPTVSTTSLATAGATAGRTPFTLTLTGCTYPGAAYAAIATWTFVPAQGATVIGNSASNPKAANVGVQLLTANLVPISHGSNTTLASINAAGSYSTSFFAQYYATSAAGAGNVTGQATFTLSYQ